MQYSGYSTMLKHECHICRSDLHNENDCGIINFKPKKSNLILRLNHSIANERNANFIRKKVEKVKKFPTLLQREERVEQRMKILDNFKLRKYLKDIQFHLRKIEREYFL